MTASDGASPRAGGPRLVSKSAFIAASTLPHATVGGRAMGSNDAIAGGTSGRWRNNGICVSRSAPQPSGFLFFRVCVFHNVAHSSAWCAPLSTERQPGRASIPQHAIPIANYTFAATGSHNHGITARSSVECSSMVRTSTVNGYMFGSVRVG